MMTSRRVTRVYARKIGGRYDIGNLDDYVNTVESLKKLAITRANARVGLIGNPSDGFNGKTISYSLANYWAQVKIWESKTLDLLPNEVFDTTRFSSLAELATKTQITGYYGGIRLLRATCKRFYELTKAADITLTKNFSLCYNSNIPFGKWIVPLNGVTFLHLFNTSRWTGRLFRHRHGHFQGADGILWAHTRKPETHAAQGNLFFLFSSLFSFSDFLLFIPPLIASK